MEFLDKTAGFLSQVLAWIGGVVLVGMVLLTSANIFLRLVYVPLPGTVELMGLFGAIITGFSLAYTQIRKSHIAVDLLVIRFSAKTQLIVNSINWFIGTSFFGIAGWYLFKWAMLICETGEVTETLRIIYYPFIYAVALSCFILALVLFIDLLKLLTRKMEIN